MKLKILGHALLFLFCNTSFAQNENTNNQVRFEDLPRLVREKNEKVQSSEILVSASQKRTGYLARSFLPQLNLKAGNQAARLGSDLTENQEYWSAESQLNLYRGGRDKIEEKSRQAQVLKSKAELSRDYQDELRSVRKIYWQIVANSNLLADLTDAVEQNSQNIKGSRRRTGAGVATNADTVHFELENTTMTQQLKRLSIEQDLLKSQLAVAIGNENHENLEVSASFDPLPKAFEITPSTTVDNPDSEIIKMEETLHRLEKDRASKWWAPSLDLFATYRSPNLLDHDRSALARENEFITGIQVSMNLGAGFEDQAQKSSEELKALAASKRLLYAQKTVSATRHELEQDLKLLSQLIQDADKDVEKSAQFLKMTKTEYGRGVKNGPDLLEAFLKYYEFRARRTDLYRLYHQNLAELDYQNHAAK